MIIFFFFKQKTAYEIGTGDWSSDVCSSDLFVWEDVQEENPSTKCVYYAVDIKAIWLSEFFMTVCTPDPAWALKRESHKAVLVGKLFSIHITF